MKRKSIYIYLSSNLSLFSSYSHSSLIYLNSRFTLLQRHASVLHIVCEEKEKYNIYNNRQTRERKAAFVTRREIITIILNILIIIIIFFSLSTTHYIYNLIILLNSRPATACVVFVGKIHRIQFPA